MCNHEMLRMSIILTSQEDESSSLLDSEESELLACFAFFAGTEPCFAIVGCFFRGHVPKPKKMTKMSPILVQHENLQLPMKQGTPIFT